MTSDIGHRISDIGIGTSNFVLVIVIAIVIVLAIELFEGSTVIVRVP